MSQKEIDEIVSEFRKSTCDISDEEVADVLKLCRRKIEITGESEDYMKLLLPDKLKNHCFRMAANVVSLSRMIRKEYEECLSDITAKEYLEYVGEKLATAQKEG